MEHIPSRTPNLIWRTVEENLVIVSPTHGKVRVLNPVGAIIWERIDGEATVGEIAGSLHARFAERAAADLDADLTHFLSDLSGKGLIQWEPN